MQQTITKNGWSKNAQICWLRNNDIQKRIYYLKNLLRPPPLPGSRGMPESRSGKFLLRIVEIE